LIYPLWALQLYEPDFKQSAIKTELEILNKLKFLVLRYTLDFQGMSSQKILKKK